MSLDLTLIIFDHVGGAERAYADVLGVSAASPWVHEIAFVEHHRHDRIVVRGTFAGRYVDVDDEADVVIGKRTAEGALTGAVAGVLFGPAGLAVGLVGGAAAGSVGDARARPISTTRSSTRCARRYPRSPPRSSCSRAPSTPTP